LSAINAYGKDCNIKTYILGLESAFRGNKLIANLSNPIFEIEKFSGLDARSLLEEDLLKYYSPEKTKLLLHRQISSAEIGCAFSHNLIYQNMVKNSINSALVLEDDAKLINLDKLISTMNQFQSDLRFREIPSVLQLGSQNFTDKNSKGLIMSIRFPGYCTYAYILNLAAAHKLFNSSLKIYSTADWPLTSMDVKWFRSPTVLFENGDQENSIISQERNIVYDENKNHIMAFLQKTNIRIKLLSGYQIYKAFKLGLPWKLILKWEFLFKPYRKFNK